MLRSTSSTTISRTPEQTISSAQQAQRAALAPQQPSSQDRAVAARAGQRIQQAQIEIAQLKAADAAAKPTQSEPAKADQQPEPTEPSEQPAIPQTVTAAGSSDLKSSRQQEIQQDLDIVA